VEQPNSRSAQAVFDDHLRLAQEWMTGPEAFAEDLARNYSQDIVLLTARGVFRGHVGMRRCMNSSLQDSLPSATFEYRTRLVEGEIAFLEWSARSDKATVQDGADSYLIRDGRMVA
jgi:hypothetical protein